MNFNDIFSMIRSNLSLGFTIFALVLSLFALAYILIYKKLMGGRRRLDRKNLILVSLLLVYIFMVLGATLIDRSGMGRSFNLHLFSSYREAWNQWSLRAWQYQILNIAMFIPFGFLLALIWGSFRKFKNIFFASLAFTLFIETSQALTGRGVFELDDIFNNLLGGIIGYLIFMGLKTIFIRKKPARGLAYFTPILALGLGFSLILSSYQAKELGNLYIDPNYRYNTKNLDISRNFELDDRRTKGTIYRLSRLDNGRAEEKARSIFKKFGVDDSNLLISNHGSDNLYKLEPYILWIDKSDGSYSLSDMSMDSEKLDRQPSRDEIYRLLDEIHISLPENLDYRLEEGQSRLEAQLMEDGDRLVDGYISLASHGEKIYRLENKLISYEPYSQEDLKSQKEVYEELKEGKFNYYRDGLKTMELVSMEEAYILDSKGYYQPVFSIKGLFDGEEGEIYMRRLEDR